MNKIIISILLVLNVNTYAQQYKNQIKGNVLFAPIGIINVGYERYINKHWTWQSDVFVSLRQPIFGGGQLGMLYFEGRYYFNEVIDKWYIGGHMGISVFSLQKWNYPDHYFCHKGFSIMAGTTIGYQINFKNRWNIDVYIGGGNSRSFYREWDMEDTASKNNLGHVSLRFGKNNEWLLYRGGVMASYKF
ncbi:DUF3575 domain-containing protein [Elizabethkingia ursingii]